MKKTKEEKRAVTNVDLSKKAKKSVKSVTKEIVKSEKPVKTVKTAPGYMKREKTTDRLNK